MFEDFVHFVRDLYGTNDLIPLHEPRFRGKEKQYLLDTIDSTFVSSVGGYVEEFERKVVEYTGVRHAIATVNGTAALHTALILAGVKQDDEVITQSFTFVATCNAIRYCNAEPVFVDVDRETLGLSGESLTTFLEENAEVRNDGICWNRKTGRPIRACVPMHTFGHPVHLNEIRQVCDRYNITLVEDAAESLGSFYKEQHTGVIGKLAALSFNGNKIITTGGGGMVLTNDDELAFRAKHITTTARVPHQWAVEHDGIGFNYRLPNLNAALGVAQMEQLPEFVKNKRDLATRYNSWCAQNGVCFIKEPSGSHSNYWLNAILIEDRKQRDAMLAYTNTKQVMTRPAWTPMHKLPMFAGNYRGNLESTEWIMDRVLNIPSSTLLL